MPLYKERFEQLIAHSPDIVAGTDRAGFVNYYNDGAQRVLGYAPEEILGKYVGILYPDLDEAKRVLAAMRSADFGAPGVIETFRTRFVAKNGEEIPVAISGTVLYDDQGNEAGTIGFAKDLREILHRDKLATLGEVAIGLSHEINNPLAVVLNQVELLERDIFRLAREECDCAPEVERLDAVRREVARIAEIITRLGEMVEFDRYETIEYSGPAKMVDLRSKVRRAPAVDPLLQGLRILVVDDDQGVCLSISEILEKEGCKVRTAADGLEALEELQQGGFDVVLSDVVMPRMDGYDLFVVVKDKYPGLPMMMMTAFHYDRDHIIKRSRMEGLTGLVFKKPVDPDQLRKALHEIAEKNQHSAPH